MLVWSSTRKKVLGRQERISKGRRRVVRHKSCAENPFFSSPQHRDTQETLAVLERLDLDTEKPTEEELARKFGYEDAYVKGKVNWWQHLKPKLWSLMDEPYSSNAAKVKNDSLVFVFFCRWFVGKKTSGNVCELRHGKAFPCQKAFTTFDKFDNQSFHTLSLLFIPSAKNESEIAYERALTSI